MERPSHSIKALSLQTGSRRFAGAGLTADLSVTRGLAAAADAALANMLDPVTGRLRIINDSFATRIEDVDKLIARHTKAAEQRRDQLLKQFVALERTVSQLQGLGSYLNTQLAQINALATQPRR